MTQNSIAIAGTGFIAAAHALAARERGVPITSFGSRHPAAAMARCRELGAPAHYYNMLPAGAGTVIVTTPPFRHHADTMAMLAAGATVIVEKPLCTTLEQADELVAAGAVRVGYGENLLYAPIIAAIHAHTRTLAPLTQLEVRALQGTPTWGKFTTDAWGGGALFDLGVHPLAVTMLLAAPATVASVSCQLGGASGHLTDEHAEVELTFSNGLRAQVVASWRFNRPVWDVQAVSATSVVRAELMGEQSLEVHGVPHALAPATSTIATLDQLGYTHQLVSMLEDFAAEREPLSSVAFGRTVLDIVCAAYQSAGQAGTAVKVPFAGPRNITPLHLWRS